MKAKELAEILNMRPEAEVEFAIHSYCTPDDSVGIYAFMEIDIVSVRTAPPGSVGAIVLSSGQIGFPESSSDFKILNP